MIIDKKIIVDFSVKDFKEVYLVPIPEGSKLLKVMALHDGIYAWYAIPSMVMKPDVNKFVIVKPGESIPPSAELIDILDTIVETKKGQAVVVYPIFKLKE